jgi:hypothetical protein
MTAHLYPHFFSHKVANRIENTLDGIFVLMQGRNGRHLLLAGQQKGVAAAAVLIKRKEKRADSIVCAERKVLVIGNSPKIHIYTHSIRSLVDHHIGPSSSPSPVS